MQEAEASVGVSSSVQKGKVKSASTARKLSGVGQLLAKRIEISVRGWKFEQYVAFDIFRIGASTRNENDGAAIDDRYAGQVILEGRVAAIEGVHFEEWTDVLAIKP